LLHSSPALEAGATGELRIRETEGGEERRRKIDEIDGGVTDVAPWYVRSSDDKGYLRALSVEARLAPMAALPEGLPVIGRVDYESRSCEAGVIKRGADCSDAKPTGAKLVKGPAESEDLFGGVEEK
jgi:hypothetical protein